MQPSYVIFALIIKIKEITMAAIKSCTDIEQSKKLAEILPLESADMYYFDDNGEPNFKVRNGITYYYDNEDFLCCWSLAALLGVLPKYIGGSVLRIDMSENDFSLWFDDLSGIVDEILPDITKDNPVDACVAMIEKLNELNLL